MTSDGGEVAEEDQERRSGGGGGGASENRFGQRTLQHICIIAKCIRRPSKMDGGSGWSAMLGLIWSDREQGMNHIYWHTDYAKLR